MQNVCEGDSIGHAKRLDCGSIAAALESRGFAAAPQRCCGVYESGGKAAAVQTTTASSSTGKPGRGYGSAAALQNVCEGDSIGHAKRLDCGSIAAALESRGFAAAPQRCCGV